jgi:hypothetical protein
MARPRAGGIVSATPTAPELLEVAAYQDLDSTDHRGTAGGAPVDPVETMLDALERAGGGPKQSGTSWSARCTLEAILAVLELQPADLFPVAKTNGSGMEIAATYDYTDESGELSYQVVRLAPKSFRQRRPNGRGGWTWKLGNATRVPFHLPNLITGVAEGKWIFVVDGEKDVLRLEAAGFVATSNSGGAGKFLPTFVPYFKGARVAILPDNDETGRAHAEQVALILAPTAAEVRVVELPRLAEHGDVSDFLNNGGSAVELKALLLEVQAWQPPRNKIVPLRVIAEGVDDDAAATVLTVRSRARRMASRQGLGLVIVGYLQLLTHRETENRQTQVAEISRELKRLARELRVPVVAVSQLSRNLEAREDKVPRLADLRESGQLEQDADAVLFLHRPVVYDDEADPGVAHVIVAKHRNGPTGLVPLTWLPLRMRSADRSRREAS